MFSSQFHCHFLLTISENSDTSSDSENEFNNENDNDNYDKERVPKKDKGMKRKGKKPANVKARHGGGDAF